MPWCVAEFYPHRDYCNFSVQVVPSSWVQKVGELLLASFPPESYSMAAIRRAVKEEKLPEDGWEDLLLHYVSEDFDSLTDARALEAEAADCSDTELEVFVDTFMRSQTKRRRKLKKHLYPSESSDSGSLENIPDGLPASPILPTRKNMEDQMGRVITTAVSNPSGALKTQRIPQFNMTAPSTADGGHAVERLLHTSQLPSSSEATPIVITHVHSLRQPESSEGDVSLRDIMTAVRRLERQMTVEHTGLSEKIDALAAKLDAVVPQLKDPTCYDVELLHDLPATSHKGLFEVEQELEKNLEYRKFLINYLKRRCSRLLPNTVGQVQVSASITKCVNDCCVALMSNELASTYSMTGRSQNRTSFSGTFINIIDVVCVSVNEKVGGVLEISMKEVRSRMGEWMRQAFRRTEVGKAARVASYAAQVRARSSTAHD